MFQKIKHYFFLLSFLLFIMAVSCKKGTFDINNSNPNVPSNVSPKFILSAALKTTASIVRGGDADFAELYMGYWALSGDYIPVTATLTYATTTDYYQDNWNASYTVLRNYRQIEQLSTANPNSAYYVGISKIMQAFHFARLVDLYNNIPYTNALQGGTVNFPTYDDAATVYAGVVKTLDSAVLVIQGAPVTAENPNNYDAMFKGNMTEWIQFAHTIKLKILLNLSETSGGAAAITAGLSGLTSKDFLQAGQDASINPGYSNSSNAQQSPFYQDMGFSTSGAAQNNESYYRANSYAVNFMVNTGDTLRLPQIYAFNTQGAVKGRAFGSTAASGEDNQHISGMGPGLLKKPDSAAIILPAFESLFMQAEAVQRGFLTGLGTAASLYQMAVEESFRVLQVPNPQASADSFITNSTNPNVNLSISTNPLQTIIVQEWVAVNGFDPVQAWNNWRRLKIPTDLPVSIFPGTTATHIPYRLLYPTTEYSYNDVNVNKEGAINNMSSKIFWMP